MKYEIFVINRETLLYLEKVNCGFFNNVTTVGNKITDFPNLKSLLASVNFSIKHKKIEKILINS